MEPPAETVPMPPRRPGLSPWSILALVTSLGLCPFITILSIPLGLLGLRDSRVNGRRGRTCAWIGIVIGVIITPLTGWFMYWWNANVRIPMLYGPTEALVAGMDGNIKGFEAGFIPVDATLPETEAAAFINQVRERWGSFISIEQDASREVIYVNDRMGVRVPYLFRFEKGVVPGEAQFDFLQEVGSVETGMKLELVTRFSSVIIGETDPISWPPSVASEERVPLPLAGEEVDELEDSSTDG